MHFDGCKVNLAGDFKLVREVARVLERLGYDVAHLRGRSQLVTSIFIHGKGRTYLVTTMTVESHSFFKNHRFKEVSVSELLQGPTVRNIYGPD